MYYAYILSCADGTLYTGYTTDLVRRLAVHNGGKGAKYTRSRRPVVLRYAERFSAREKAMSREREIKALSRREKLDLIENFQTVV